MSTNSHEIELDELDIAILNTLEKNGRFQGSSAENANFRELADSLPVIVFENDVNGRPIFLNRAFTEQMGYTFAEVIDKQPQDLIVPVDRDPHEVSRQNILAGNSESTQEFRVLRKDGSTFPAFIHRTPVFDGETVIGTRGIVINISKHKQLEEQRRHLAALTERERIGRELHDDLGQVLGFINVQSQAIQSHIAAGKIDQANAALTQLIQVSQAAHDDLRHYILSIRTNADQKAEQFLPEIASYIQSLQEQYGFVTDLDMPTDWEVSPFSPQVEIQLLRIIQEALTNVRKHAGTHQAHLKFEEQAREIHILIEDHGQGILPKEAGNTPHFGLSIMRERAEQAGGRLDIQSQPGQGTQILITIPRPTSENNVPLTNTRVLLVDDSPLYLEGLHNLLTSRGITVVGTAPDGLVAQEKARQLRPDLILMDIHMPHCDGLEATLHIMAEMPETKIVMLTVAAEEALLFKALKYGAVGYLLKSMGGNQFFRLLSDVLAGEIALSPSLASQVLTEFAHHHKIETDSESGELPALTPRQTEILTMIAQGQRNKEIATALFISENTVKSHVRQILKLLRIQNRYELARIANEQGYTPLKPS